MTLVDTLDLIGPRLRDLIRLYYKSDSCIASTRIGIDVLAGLGISARPLQVEAMIFNAAMLRLMQAGPIPLVEPARTELFDSVGAYAVGLGTPEPDDDGLHVVAIVADQVLWDLSLDQGSRPKYDIQLGPLAVEITTPDFLRTESLLVVGDPSRGKIRYKSRPADDGFSHSHNWRPDGRDAPLRAELVSRVLTMLNSAGWRRRLHRAQERAA